MPLTLGQNALSATQGRGRGGCRSGPSRQSRPPGCWGACSRGGLGVPVAGVDSGDFLADTDEGVFDEVQLAARLALGGCNHDGAGGGKLMVGVYGDGVLAALLVCPCFRLLRLKTTVRA